jgi:hypothetical protein
VFPNYAAQFLHILNGIEDSIVPLYNEVCQTNLLKVQANAPAQNTKQKKVSTCPIPPPTPIPSSLPTTPQQYQPQKLEDHQILRKTKKKPIQDTPDEIFDYRIRTKSDLLQLGELDCVCRFCKTALCPSSELAVAGSVIWCDSSQICNQVLSFPITLHFSPALFFCPPIPIHLADPSDLMTFANPSGPFMPKSLCSQKCFFVFFFFLFF